MTPKISWPELYLLYKFKKTGCQKQSRSSRQVKLFSHYSVGTCYFLKLFVLILSNKLQIQSSLLKWKGKHFQNELKGLA
jgi:hypothetical protein